MKRLYLFVFLAFSSVIIYAQDIRFTIRNMDDVPLINVELTNLKSGKVYHSDDNGVVCITGNLGDTILFDSENYSLAELTINNIRHSNNEVILFPKLHVNLAEVTVAPINIYAIYRIAAANLKNRLTKNEQLGYRCVGTEKEINMGGKRSLDAIFSSTLKKADARKDRLKYDFYLSKLETSSDSTNCVIMKDNKYRIYLFTDNIQKDIVPYPEDVLEITDSTIIIHRRNSDMGFTGSLVINKEDTTLIEMNSEVIELVKKYRKLRTFSAKNIYALYKVKYEKNENEDGYYLNYMNVLLDASFLLRNPRREEHLVCAYEISKITKGIDADLKFIPKNKYFYEMVIYGKSE